MITSNRDTCWIRSLPGCSRQPPHAWLTDLNERALDVVVESAVLQIAGRTTLANAEREQLGRSIWEHVRSIPIDDAGRTVEWGLRQSPMFTIEAVIRKLLEGGDLLATLRRERDRLDAEIQRLAKLTQVAQ